MFYNSFLSNSYGATAVEYSLVAAGIALTIVVTLFAFGQDLAIIYEGLSTVTDGTN